MPQNYQTISHSNIAKGMDTKASPNQIAPGYAELIENMDTNTAGYVEKRKGYRSHFGDLPVGGFYDASVPGEITLEQNPDLPGSFVFESGLSSITIEVYEVQVDGTITRSVIAVHQSTQAGTSTVICFTAGFTDGSFIWFYGIPESFFVSGTLPKINGLTKYATESETYLLALRNGRLFKELSYASASATEKSDYFSGWDGTESLGEGSNTDDFYYSFTTKSNDNIYRNWLRQTGSTVTEGGVVCANATASGYVPVTSITVLDGDVGALDAGNWVVDIVLDMGTPDGSSDTLDLITAASSGKQGYNDLNYAATLRIQNSPVPGLSDSAIPMIPHPTNPTTTVRLSLSKTTYTEILPTTITNTAATVGFFDHVFEITLANSIGTSSDSATTLASIDGLGTVNRTVLGIEGSSGTENLVRVEFVDGENPNVSGEAHFTTTTNDISNHDGDFLSHIPQISDQIIVAGQNALVISVSATSITLDRLITIDGSDTSVSWAGRWVPVDALGTANSSTGLSATERIRASGMSDSTFFTDGVLNKLIKYDGVNWYTAGIPSFDVQATPYINFSNQALSLAKVAVDTYQDTAGNRWEVTRLNPVELNFSSSAAMPDVSVGDTVGLVKIGATPHTAKFTDKVLVVGIEDSGSTHQISVLPATRKNFVFKAAVTPADFYFMVPKKYYCYYKYSFIDRNGNEIVSNISGFGTEINLYAPGTIHHSLQLLPKFGNYDYDHIDVEVYRTLPNPSSLTNDYFRVGRKSVYSNLDKDLIKPLTIVDNIPDILLDDGTREDTRSVALKGANLPLSIEAPMKAKYINTINNKLVLGNVTRPPRAAIEFVYTGSDEPNGQKQTSDGDAQSPLKGKYVDVKVVDDDSTRTYRCRFLSTTRLDVAEATSGNDDSSDTHAGVFKTQGLFYDNTPDSTTSSLYTVPNCMFANSGQMCSTGIQFQTSGPVDKTTINVGISIAFRFQARRAAPTANGVAMQMRI